MPTSEPRFVNAQGDILPEPDGLIPKLINEHFVQAGLAIVKHPDTLPIVIVIEAGTNGVPEFGWATQVKDSCQCGLNVAILGLQVTDGDVDHAHFPDDGQPRGVSGQKNV